MKQGSKFIPAIILIVGLILMSTQLIGSIGTWLRLSLIKVTYPATYRFPAYDKLLHACVKGSLVDYSYVKQSPLLNQSVDEVQHISVDKMTGERERICFWINTYNLLVLKTIADKYPINSAKKISLDFSRSKYVVGGAIYSVQDVYLGEINPYLKTHTKALFLLNGGAMGYPALLDHVIEPSRMSADEDYAAFEFITNAANVKYDDVRNVFLLSPLFDWNADNFIPDFGSPFEFANMYLPPEKKVDLEMASMLKTYFRNFDWRLNDTALQPAKTETAGMNK